MTTIIRFTKEQLIARADHLLCVGKAFIAEHPEYDGMAKDVELFKIALASLTAEPVAWTDADELRDANNGGSGYLFSIGGDANKFSDPRSQIMLFTAPPTPVVPDALPENDDEEGNDIDYMEPSEIYVLGRTAGWNACRAAMLQDSQPVSNRDELPSRERFISLCNEFWNWSEMDLVCADDKGYEMRMEWDGKVFTHPVTQSLWRMYQAAPGNSPVIPDSSEDTKRLNWLDAQNKRLNEYYGTSYGWKFDANFQRNAMMLNDSNYPVMTVRQAIDQAITAAPQQEAE